MRTMIKQPTAALAHYLRRLNNAEGEQVYAVHIGLNPEAENVPPTYWAWVTDQDSWDEWGEPFTKESSAQHIIILTGHPAEMIDALMAESTRLDLVPMNDGGTLIVVSDPHDWGQQYVYFTVKV